MSDYANTPNTALADGETVQASFAADRATMEELFGELVANERLSFDQYQQIRDTGARMQEQLNSIIRDVAARDHMKATSFLTSLLYEARLVAG